MKLRSISLLLVIVVASAVLTCSDDDCPVCPAPFTKPAPYDGWVYTTADWNAASVYKIDAATGLLEDSIYRGTYDGGAGYVDVTSDGRYLVVTYTGDFDTVLGRFGPGYTCLLDAQTLEPIQDIPFKFTPIFDNERNLLLGFRNDSLYCFSVPGLEVVYADSIGSLWEPMLYEPDTLVYGAKSEAHDSVIAYNYLTRDIRGSWNIRNDAGVSVYLGKLDIHPDGSKLYFVAEERNSKFSIFGAWDLRFDMLVSSFPMASDHGDVRVSPSGKEVYVTDPGVAGFIFPSPGSIFVFDASDCNYITGISLYGYGTTPGYPLQGNWIAFTPNASHAFVSTGRVEKASGTMLMIDVFEKRIVHLTWPELGHVLYFVAVGPKR